MPFSSKCGRKNVHFGPFFSDVFKDANTNKFLVYEQLPASRVLSQLPSLTASGAESRKTWELGGVERAQRATPERRQEQKPRGVDKLCQATSAFFLCWEKRVPPPPRTTAGASSTRGLGSGRLQVPHKRKPKPRSRCALHRAAGCLFVFL